MADELTRWLRRRGPDGLADVLSHRPDVTDEPPPATLADLAQRLAQRWSVQTAALDLDAALLGVAEVVLAVGPMSRADLAETLPGLPAPVLDRVLDELARRALVWDDEGGTLHAAGGLSAVWRYPLGLAERLRPLLGNLQPNLVHTIARTLGVPAGSSRSALHVAIVGHLTADRVRHLIATAPPQAAELLESVQSGGPLVEVEPTLAHQVHQLRPQVVHRHPVLWAVAHALLLPAGWDLLVVPREVTRATVGRWRVDVAAEPPDVPTSGAHPDEVERSGAAAAAAFLGLASTLLELVCARPVPLLKAGGVGVRELRRLARSAATDEPTVGLVLELAGAAELVAVGDAGLVTTPDHDSWRARPPGERLGTLLGAWWSAPHAHTGRRDPQTGRPATVLGHPPWEPAALQLRHALLREAGALAPDRAVADLAALSARARWHRPLGFPPVDDPQGATDTAVWDESGRLGAVAAGALTGVGRALIGPGPGPDWVAALEAACAAVLPEPTSTVALQTDLTAVVGGPPSVQLSDLLDAAAEREARGSASVWRFSSGSVRRWLDGGETADDLLARLAEHAPRGVPQPLEYLVRDAARRHGHLSVAPLRCAVVSADEALLAEVAAHRALRQLGLRALAATVLASQRPIAETVGALRDAGYAPVTVDAHGSAVIEGPGRRAAAKRPARQRPTPRPRPPGRPAGGSPTRELPDPADLARRLLASPDSAPPPVAPPPSAPARTAWRRQDDVASTAALLRTFASALSAEDHLVLARAIADVEPVHVRYASAAGSVTQRTLSELDLDPPFLHAWCHLRQDERTFALDRLVRVSPV